MYELLTPLAFPHHTIPDGSVMYPHHLYIGLLLIAVVVFRVADTYRDREPVGVLVGGLVTTFAFVTLWGTVYPLLGALGTLVGLAVATVALASRRVWTARDGPHYPLTARALVALGLAVAWDDALEHAFGVTTPLDWLWTELLYPAIQQLPTAI
jgi:hypothetical protein